MSRITPERSGFGVAPSPFNAVKLDLGLIVCVAVPVWLVVGRLELSASTQVLVLGGYGVVGMLWLIARTQYILSRVKEIRPDRPHWDGIERDGEDRIESPLAD